MSDPLASPDVSVESLVAEATDDFLDRLARGERPSVEEYAGRYPAIAGVLRQVLPALQAMRSEGAEPAADAAPGGPVPAGCLGDFRLLREVGRGGMGVVYEAEQISLGRRVALKVLPFAAALDARQLQRFRTEAQAAAQLHHTNIVPVHFVGSERGVHFYAMQFIDGPSLAAVIAQLRQLAGRDPAGPGGPPGALSRLVSEFASGRWAPADGPPTEPVLGADTEPPPAAGQPTERSITNRAFFRTAARLAVQAAEALEQAHQLGIVHRDVKPANLLVDGRGRLWVTDFGLAQVQSDARLTLSGDVVGTVRYMSPEQARVRPGPVDHRTDLYSLGATLYELLTLQSAFAGRCREDLLRHIAFREPRPPRRVNPAVPPELDIIVLKAMAKEPAQRYATAQELADDLRRFLEDRPIRARRPTALQRLRSWSRRHRPVVWSAVVTGVALAVIAFAALAVSYAYVRAERDAKEQALDVAERQRQLAEANLDLARRAVDEVYEQWAASPSPLPETEPARRQTLLKALEFYQEFAKQRGSDRRIRSGTGAAYLRIAMIQYSAGQQRKAEEAITEALRLFGDLAAEDPAEPGHQAALASAHSLRGQVLTDARQSPAAEQSLHRAAELWTKLVAAQPANRGYRAAQVRDNLRLALVAARPEEATALGSAAVAQAERLLAESPGEPDYADLLAEACLQVGRRHHLEGHRHEAEVAFRKVLALENTPGARSRGARVALANAYVYLAHVLRETGRTREAAGAYRQAVARYEKAAVAFRHSRSVWTALYGEGYGGLAALLETTGSTDELTALQQKAVDTFAEFAAEVPDDPTYHEALGRVARALPGVVKDRGPSAGKEELYRRILEVTQQLAARFPNQPVYTFRVAYWRSHVGEALWSAGRTPEAEEALREAAADYRAFLSREPEHALALNNLAWLLVTCPAPGLHDGRQALELARKAAALRPRDHYVHNTLGIAAYRAGDLPAAVAALEQSLALNAGRPEAARAESFDTFFLAMVRWRQGDRAAARADYERAVRWMEKYRPNDQELRRFHAEAEALLGP